MRRFSKKVWGWYFTIIDAKYFKVKILRFYKGLSCSKQKHEHRNELWLMLRGSGILNSRLLRDGGWHAVHKNLMHKFTAKKPSWILEIQYGDICSEEDIIRS